VRCLHCPLGLLLFRQRRGARKDIEIRIKLLSWWRVWLKGIRNPGKEMVRETVKWSRGVANLSTNIIHTWYLYNHKHSVMFSTDLMSSYVAGWIGEEALRRSRTPPSFCHIAQNTRRRVCNTMTVSSWNGVSRASPNTAFAVLGYARVRCCEASLHDRRLRSSPTQITDLRPIAAYFIGHSYGSRCYRSNSVTAQSRVSLIECACRKDKMRVSDQQCVIFATPPKQTFVLVLF